MTDNPFSAASQILIDYLYSYFNARVDSPQFLASNNLGLPRALFQELGGFDTRFLRAGGEDRELCDRLRSRGHKMLVAPEMVVYHSHTLSLRQFVWQHFTYGRGAYHFHRARAEANKEPIRLEPLPFYWNLLCIPFRQPRVERSVLTATLLFVSQVTNVAGFFAEASLSLSGGRLPFRHDIRILPDWRHSKGQNLDKLA